MIATTLLTLIASYLVICSNAYQSSTGLKGGRALRFKPLQENFFLDIAADPKAATPPELYGEVNYKNFAAQTVPDGLLSREYDIITRTRELKLLSLVADSGLLEALESKGLTLSQVEKLLPVLDDLNLLTLAAKNKQLILSLAPLLIEPAPLLLPVAVTVLKTPASTFLYPGLAALAVGAFETGDNLLLAIPLILLGLPLAAVGAVLNSLNFSSLPAVPTQITPSKVSAVSEPLSLPKLPILDSRPRAGKVKKTIPSDAVPLLPAIQIPVAKPAPAPVVKAPVVPVAAKPVPVAAPVVAAKPAAPAPVAVKAAPVKPVGVTRKRAVVRVK